ncbi:hypothetical protein ACH4S8_32500 [Streptomyces sp. NPDC021080]|uniref:hypothetical protein n=1 Tax=Streptomyces sp. NPDC021080 TaxID=3365110 RepID=UPI0037A6480C
MGSASGHTHPSGRRRPEASPPVRDVRRGHTERQVDVGAPARSLAGDRGDELDAVLPLGDRRRDLADADGGHGLDHDVAGQLLHLGLDDCPRCQRRIGRRSGQPEAEHRHGGGDGLRHQLCAVDQEQSESEGEDGAEDGEDHPQADAPVTLPGEFQVLVHLLVGSRVLPQCLALGIHGPTAHLAQSVERAARGAPGQFGQVDERHADRVEGDGVPGVPGQPAERFLELVARLEPGREDVQPLGVLDPVDDTGTGHGRHRAVDQRRPSVGRLGRLRVGRLRRPGVGQRVGGRVGRLAARGPGLAEVDHLTPGRGRRVGHFGFQTVEEFVVVIGVFH